MQLSEEKLWALQQLGIPVWHQREAEQHQSAPSPADNMSSNMRLESAAISATILVCISAAETPAERHLQANILKVISGLDIPVECRDLSALDGQNLPQNILVFGQLSWDASLELGKRCLLLPSLSDLIADPRRKADVWTQLCHLRQQVC